MREAIEKTAKQESEKEEALTPEEYNAIRELNESRAVAHEIAKEIVDFYYEKNNRSPD